MKLFCPVVGYEAWHENFRNLWLQRNPWNECVIAEWSQGFDDRDGKFVKEFQTTFNSCFWELYLFACFKQLGFSMDFSFNAPDFLLSNGSTSVCVEAVVANHAHGSTAEWQARAEEPHDFDRAAIVKQAIPRLTNALLSKHRKYTAEYSSKAHVNGRPFILALAPFDQPGTYGQTDQAIRNVLYQYDVPIYQDIPEENRRLIFGHEYIEYVVKPNGSKIELGFFLDDRMKEISAVMFSNTATWGKVRALSLDPNPNIIFESWRYNDFGLRSNHRLQRKSEYHETLLDGMHIFINPFATHSVPPKFLNWADTAYHSMDTKSLVPIDESPDGFLYKRSLSTYPPELDVEEALAAAQLQISK